MDVKAEIDEFADDWGLTDFQTKDLEGFAARVRDEAMEEACRAVASAQTAGWPEIKGHVAAMWRCDIIDAIRSAFSADAKREGAGNGPELRCCVCHQFSARRLWNERLCPRCGYWNAESEGEVCWLIERSQPEGQSDICWWAGGNRTGSCSPWTWDAGKAMRYPTKIAAEAALDEISGVKGIHRPMGHVTEHAFVPMPVPANAKADVNKRERGSIECSVCEKSSTYSAWNGDVCPMCGENNAKAEEPPARDIGKEIVADLKELVADQARAQFDKAAVELATWVAGELPSGRYLLVREMCNKILDATRTLGIEGATP